MMKTIDPLRSQSLSTLLAPPRETAARPLVRLGHLGGLPSVSRLGQPGTRPFLHQALRDALRLRESVALPIERHKTAQIDGPGKPFGLPAGQLPPGLVQEVRYIDLPLNQLDGAGEPARTGSTRAWKEDDGSWSGVIHSSSTASWHADNTFNYNPQTGVLRIDVPVNFVPDPGIPPQELEARIAEWQKGVQEAWNQSFQTADGRTIRVEVNLVRSPSTGRIVKVHAGPGRSNTAEFYMGADGRMAAHETGHFLGLDDEYAEAPKPTGYGRNDGRVLTEEDTLMNGRGGVVPEYLSAFERLVAGLEGQPTRARAQARQVVEAASSLGWDDGQQWYTVNGLSKLTGIPQEVLEAAALKYTKGDYFTEETLAMMFEDGVLSNPRVEDGHFRLDADPSAIRFRHSELAVLLDADVGMYVDSNQEGISFDEIQRLRAEGILVVEFNRNSDGRTVFSLGSTFDVAGADQAIAALDQDDDGKLSTTEFSDPLAPQMFEEYDWDQDNFLEVDEYATMALKEDAF